MRRLTRAALVLVLLAACASAVEAQQVPTRSGGIADLVTASVSATNTTLATTLYSKVIPANFYSNFAAPIPGSGSLHLRMLGTISTAATPGTLNIGCNYGGSTATIALANATTLTASLNAVPVMIDVWLANVNPAPTSTGSQILSGRLAVVGASATETVTNAAVIGTTVPTVNQTLSCAVQWGLATGSLIIWNSVLHVGM